MAKSQYSVLIYIATLAAQGVIISLLENFIPSPFVFAPGAKLGLANLITIIAIFTLPIKYSIQVVTIRLLLTALLGGTLSTFLYSAAGGYLSYVIMLLLQTFGPRLVSIVGISVMGGMMHNIGQLMVAALMAKSFSVLNYLPLLSLSGILSGFAVGMIGNFLLHSVAKLRLYHQEFVLSKHQQNWLE